MTKCPEWLSKAIFYQIYPQSFYDSNGDGIGDIPGIIEKLDYVQWLGCNAIWLNPCFCSPFMDAGYDISDYYKVAPRYGTNRDLVKLFKQAHQHGIRILLDLVPGHTSIQHPWFVQASQDKPNFYSDWYIWADWVASFENRPFIQGFAERPEGYMVNYYWCQPALNYGFVKPKYPWQKSLNASGPKAVRKEIKKIIQYWLEHGADGFRVDMALSCFKDDSDYKATEAFWKEDIGSMLEKRYPHAVLISESGEPQIALRCGFHADLLLPHCSSWGYTALVGNRFKFDINDKEYYGALDGVPWRDLAECLQNYFSIYKSTKNQGFMCPNSGSHDVGRIRHGRSLDTVKMMFAWLMTMPGVPFIYYGDEIGMNYRYLPNKEGGYRRTGSRTPMQWDNSLNRGFSRADKKNLYLPVDTSPSSPDVQSQIKNPNSLLNLIKKLVEIRNRSAALQGNNEWKIINLKNKDCLIYSRSNGDQTILIALNPYDDTINKKVKFKPSSCCQTLLSNKAVAKLENDSLQLHLPAKSFILLST